MSLSLFVFLYLHPPSFLHSSTAIRNTQTLQPTCQKVWVMELVLILGKSTLNLVARTLQRYNQVLYNSFSALSFILYSHFFLLTLPSCRPHICTLTNISKWYIPALGMTFYVNLGFSDVPLTDGDKKKGAYKFNSFSMVYYCQPINIHSQIS